MKKLLAGEGGWICIKEVLGWKIYMEVGTVTLPERKLRELLTLVGILLTQLCMVRKDIERLVGKLLSMHIAVPGAVAHFYHIQGTLTQEGGGGGVGNG